MDRLHSLLLVVALRAGIVAIVASRVSPPAAPPARSRADTSAIYRPKDWTPDSGQIFARKFRDGRFGWYAGPDAGPPTDPAAFVPLRELIPEDGWVTFPNGRRLHFVKSTDPVPAIRPLDMIYPGETGAP